MIRVIIKLLLLFVLVYVGVYLGYGRLEKQLRVSPPAVPLPKVTAKEGEKTKQVLQKTSNYQIILTRNIFEAVPEQKNIGAGKEKPEKVIEKEPEQTTLKLVLQGTVTGSDRDARAIIVDQKAKKQDLYQIGDAVQGALITSIERGKVILEVNGKKQLLVLKDRKSSGGRGGSDGINGSRFETRTSTFSRPTARSVISRKRNPATPTAVPHRRISFRRNTTNVNNAEVEPVDHEEPEEPLMEEDLEGNSAPPESRTEAEIFTE